MKIAHRPKKLIKIPDPRGGTDAKGNVNLVEKYQEVTRLALALQKLITSRSTAFATFGGMSLDASPKDDTEKAMLEALNEVFRVNKLKYKNAHIVEGIYSETEAAEIWYSKKLEDGTFQMRCEIYRPSQGYQLIPVFDNFRDLIAFGLGYESELEGKKYKHLDLYTKDELRRHVQEAGYDWKLATDAEGNEAIIKLPYGKIPVIFYQAAESVWADVQGIIERLETVASNFGDTNDYNGSPILFATGEIKGFSAKGETGKVIEGSKDSKLEYVNWEGGPESIKAEVQMLLNFIYTITQTPDISFEAMKSLGDISGVAFDRIFVDANLKAKKMQDGIYGEGVQRRINFLLSALTVIDKSLLSAKTMVISPEFTAFRIDDETTRISNAMKANGGKPVLDWESSIVMSGTTKDPKKTYELLQAQAEAEKPIIDPNKPVDPNAPKPKPEKKKPEVKK